MANIPDNIHAEHSARKLQAAAEILETIARPAFESRFHGQYSSDLDKRLAKLHRQALITGEGRSDMGTYMSSSCIYYCLNSLISNIDILPNYPPWDLSVAPNMPPSSVFFHRSLRKLLHELEAPPVVWQEINRHVSLLVSGTTYHREGWEDVMAFCGIEELRRGVLYQNIRQEARLRYSAIGRSRGLSRSGRLQLHDA